VKRIPRIALLAVVLPGALLYVGDYLSLRYRIPHGREPFGTVEVRRHYAVPLKNRQTEYMFEEPTTQVCVHSLFPHFGDPPCWYLERHRQQEINTGGAPRGY
jgi:hypothetical protein